MNYLIIILAILPVILLITYFYNKDTLKEPKKLLQKLFFSGFLSAFLVIAVSLVGLIFFPTFTNVENASIIKMFLYSFIFISLTEEFCKWIMIYKISYNNKEFDQLYDIILYSVFVGLGFACFENFLYVLGNESGLWIAIFRGITAIPAHACFQTFMGYYLTLSKFDDQKKKKKYLYLSLIIPILLHGTYDFLLLSGNIILVCIFLVFIITMFIITIIKIKRIIKIDEARLKNDICPNCQTLIKNNFCPNCGHKK